MIIPYFLPAVAFNVLAKVPIPYKATMLSRFCIGVYQTGPVSRLRFLFQLFCVYYGFALFVLTFRFYAFFKA